MSSVPLAPGAWPLVGHTVRFGRDPLGFLASLPGHGDLVRVRIGGFQAIVVCDPGTTRDVLVDDRTFDKGGIFYERVREVLGNGLGTCPHRDHRRQRRLTQPAFHPARLAGYSQEMTAQIGTVIDAWRDGQTIDVPSEMQKITTAVSLATMFGTGMDQATVTRSTQDLADIISGVYLRMLLPRPLSRLPLPANRRFLRANARLRRTIIAAIDSRGTAETSGDLLGPLQTVTGFSPADLADQAMTFFTGGVETTANTLAWALYLVSAHPAIEERLHHEVDSVLTGRLAGDEDLPRLRLTGDIITETLRLQPTVWLSTRTVTKDTRLAGHDIPAGTTIVYSPYVIHHRADLYDHPDVFDPDRWDERAHPRPPRDAFVAFGGGAHKCIGDQFGIREATLALASITARWRLRPTSRTRAEPRPRATNRPRRLRMRLVTRGDR